MMKEPTEPQRHRWFDKWMGVRGERLRGLTQELIEALDQQEQTVGSRERKRRENDKRNREVAIEIITANLAHSVLMPPDTGRLAVLTGNTGKRIARYTSPATGKALRDLLGAMDAIGIVDHRPPTRFRREASSIAPSIAFQQRVKRAGITLADFGRQEREELILLSHKPPHEDRLLGGHKEMLDYAETPKTRAMRETVRGINTFLENASITFQDDGLAPVDQHNRAMRRHFVQVGTGDQLEQGGRLYGGFWQNLERRRRPGIRIDDEPTVYLDYSSIFPRLAYAGAGVVPPPGDIYAIPGLEPYRDAVKVLVSALLFDHHNRTSWPKNADVELPSGWTVSQMRRALLERHPHLRGSFGKCLGYDLMHLESQIMVAVLDELRSRGIVALGIHDGLLVPHSRGDEVRRVMEEVALDITSTLLPVTMKPT